MLASALHRERNKGSATMNCANCNGEDGICAGCVREIERRGAEAERARIKAAWARLYGEWKICTTCYDLMLESIETKGVRR
jgi:hypothetical protein